MGIENVFFFLFGGIFLGAAIVMGRLFNASRDRSISVRAKVTGFRSVHSRSNDGRNRLSHFARFEIVEGPHAGTTGDSNVGSSRPMYDEGAVVDASYDPRNGNIVGAKGVWTMKILIAVFTVVGGGLMIAGLYIG